MVLEAPNPQLVIDVFAGEWSSKMPDELGLLSGGTADLFSDARVIWADRTNGPLAGLDVLELGPLEGGHSYMMHGLGVRSIVAVESNTRAFLRLLCVKELFGLTSLHPLLGSFLPYLQHLGDRRFDLIFASGVLYHMTEPLLLLDLACRAADRMFLWTHYYDQKLASRRDDAALFAPAAPVRLGSFTCQGARRAYSEASLDWSGFCGGAHPYAVWLTRDGILDFLRHRGFASIEIGFDDPDHPNGPSFAVSARR